MNKYNFILFSLIFLACPKIDPPDDKKDIVLTQSSLSLSLESQWTTSLKIKATVRDTADTFTFELLRDDSTIGIYTIENTPTDTIISDGPLTPSTEYQYHAFVLDGDIRTEYSDTLSAMTMDTTSHNFTWEIDTLGEYGSYLNDVWIVNENDIWVVGNIVTDSMEYNMAHWDGVEWELMGLVSQDEQIGNPGIDPIIENYSSNTIDLFAIHYFNENDIWVLSSYPTHWDGEGWTMYHLHNMGIIYGGLSNGAMWGTSSSNMYFVGFGGKIVHYDGNEFVKMESGTDVDLKDIYGIVDDESGDIIVYVCGFTQLDETVILKNISGNWSVWFQNPYEKYVNLNLNKISGPIISIWLNELNYLWAITYWGLYKINGNNSNKFDRFPDQNAWGGYINKIRGVNSTDIIFAGDRSSMWHFNGDNLLKYDEWFGDIVIYDIEINDIGVFLCGRDYSTLKAIFARGIRN